MAATSFPLVATGIRNSPVLGSNTGTPALHLIHNPLFKAVRMRSVTALNRHLAAAIDLHRQLKQAHWNVCGPGFIATHQLFDTLASGALAASDLLAEGAAWVGGTSEETIKIAIATSFPAPRSLGAADVAKHVAAVSAAFATFGQSIRDPAGATITAALLTEISRGIDLHLWLLGSLSALSWFGSSGGCVCLAGKACPPALFVLPSVPSPIGICGSSVSTSQQGREPAARVPRCDGAVVRSKRGAWDQT